VKRFFVILLLSVHLFYAGGYTLFFQYFIHRSETQMVKQIYENKVDATQLVQIKIPVHMPQMQDWPDYEHVQGQVQLKDNYYNYVGVKMTRDTMYLVCIANSVKTRLVSANLIVAKDVSDVPLTKKGSEQSSVKKASGGFEYNMPALHYSFVTFSQTLKGHENPISAKLTNPYIESPGKPPNFAG
jgi:hypothetical protein